MTLPMVGWLALILPLVPAQGGSDGAPDTMETVVLKGKVVELTAALKARGLPFDEEPVATQVVLQGADGTLTPLLRDDASRALFVDERLRNRPTEIVARRHSGLPYLQVVSFRVEDEGRLRTPEYYCDVCTISVRYPQECPCCQGPMDLRMRPESR